MQLSNRGAQSDPCVKSFRNKIAICISLVNEQWTTNFRMTIELIYKKRM